VQLSLNKKSTRIQTTIVLLISDYTISKYRLVVRLKIGVCGIACEKCPKMQVGNCPNGIAGCIARENKFCQICNCALPKGVKLCFECKDFPCEMTKQGPISYGYCQYISGKK